MYYKEDRLSNKTVVPLSSIVRPYIIKFPVSVGFGVNGNFRSYPAGAEIELSQGEFETLLTSEYGRYL